MIVFELSGPKLVPIPNFSSISLQMADFSLFCGAKSCEVPSVILLPWQQLTVLGAFVLTLNWEPAPFFCKSDADLAD